MKNNDYILAEKSIHNYAKIIGEISNLYLLKQDDFSHTNMVWDSDKKVLKSREIVLPNNFIATIEYHPNHFHFHIATNCPKLKEPMVLTRNNNLNYIIKTFQNNLNLIGLEGGKIQNMDLPYPEYLSYTEKPFLPSKNAIHLFEKIRTNVNNTLLELLTHNNFKSEVRIWPYNFDTGIYCKHPDGLEQFGGYAPADAISEFPYFYNSFYKDGKAFLPNINQQLDFGYWMNSNWKGVIYPFKEPNEVDLFLSNGALFLKQTTNKFLNK